MQTWDLIKEKKECRENNRWEEEEELRKKVKKQARSERKQFFIENT